MVVMAPMVVRAPMTTVMAVMMMAMAATMTAIAVMTMVMIAVVVRTQHFPKMLE